MIKIVLSRNLLPELERGSLENHLLDRKSPEKKENFIIKFNMRFNSKKSCRGQSLVEFSLLLSVFLMLVMGVIDIARAFSTLQTLTNASR